MNREADPLCTRYRLCVSLTRFCHRAVVRGNDSAVCGLYTGSQTCSNRFKFTSGFVPQVVIEEDDPESYDSYDDFDGCEGCELCVGQWFETDVAAEEYHGRKLVEALRNVKHGTTIEIAASCCTPRSGLVVGTSVRLIGTQNHHIRTWNAPLVVRLVYAFHNIVFTILIIIPCRICIHFWRPDDGRLCMCLQVQNPWLIKLTILASSAFRTTTWAASIDIMAE